jgi:hypothetical protein
MSAILDYVDLKTARIFFMIKGLHTNAARQNYQGN